MDTLTQQQIDGIWPTIYTLLDLGGDEYDQEQDESYHDFRERITEAVEEVIARNHGADWNVTLFDLLDPTIFEVISKIPEYDTTTFSQNKFIDYVVERKGLSESPFPSFVQAKEKVGSKKAFKHHAMLMHPTIGDPLPMCVLSFKNMDLSDIYLDYFKHLKEKNCLENLESPAKKKSVTDIYEMLDDMKKKGDKEGMEELLNEFLRNSRYFLTPKTIYTKRAGKTNKLPFLLNTSDKNCFVLPPELVEGVKNVEDFMKTKIPGNIEVDNDGLMSMTDIPFWSLVTLGEKEFHVSFRVVYRNKQYSMGIGYNKALQPGEKSMLYNSILRLVNGAGSLFGAGNLLSSLEQKKAALYTSDYLMDPYLKNEVRSFDVLSFQVLKNIQTLLLDPVDSANLHNIGRGDDITTLFLNYDAKHRRYCELTSTLPFGSATDVNCATLPGMLSGSTTASTLLTDIPASLQRSNPLTHADLRLIDEIIEKDKFPPEQMLNVLNFLRTRDQSVLPNIPGLTTVAQIPVGLTRKALPQELTDIGFDKMRNTPQSLAALLARPLPPQSVRWRPELNQQPPPQPAANSLSSSSSAAIAENKSWFDSMEESIFGANLLGSYRGSVQPPPPAPARPIDNPPQVIIGKHTREGEESDAVLLNPPVRRKLGGSKKGGKNKRTIKKRNARSGKKKRTMKKRNARGWKRRTAKKMVR